MKMWLWWEIMSLGIMWYYLPFRFRLWKRFHQEADGCSQKHWNHNRKLSELGVRQFFNAATTRQLFRFLWHDKKIRQLFARRSPNGVASFDTILNGYVTGENFRPKNRVRLVRLCGACPALEIVIREFILLKVYWMFVVYPISCDVDIFVRKKPNF